MPYKDPEKQKRAKHESYLRNKAKNQESHTARRRRNRKFIVKIREEAECSECGLKHPAIIDFHHIDPEKKKHKICDMTRQAYSIKSIQEELDKTIPLCSNCHRILHWEEKRGIVN